MSQEREECHPCDFDNNDRLIKHRMADARWRSSVASCFSLLKEVVLQKDTWDPENAGPGRISKVKILRETGDYVSRLEAIISSELQSKDASKTDMTNSQITLEKIRSDFLQLESSKFVKVKDVGPYVQQYLHLLAMEEAASTGKRQYKNLKSVEEETKGNVIVLNPNNSEALWRVPSFKNKTRKQFKKINRPIIVNVHKQQPPSLVTPRYNRTRKSPYLHRLPPLETKTLKLTGCCRPGVKRCLLDEMNGIEDADFSPASTREETGSSSQVSTDESIDIVAITADTVDQFVPEEPSFTKIIPSGGDQSVPSQDLEFGFASEIEITTSNSGRKGDLPELIVGGDSSRQENVSSKIRKNLESKKPLQIVPCLSSASITKKRRALQEITGCVTNEHPKCPFQELPPVAVSKLTKSSLPDYTALKKGMETPSHFVKFAPMFGLSPNTPETLLSREDPFLISANSEQWNSPLNFAAPGNPIDDGLYQTTNVKAEPAWPSPHHAGSDQTEKEIFEHLLHV